MMKRIRTFLLSIAVSATLCSLAFAHHGWGGYKERIRGSFTVTELKLGNPHDRLIAVDGDGREWNLLLAPPVRNRRFGFNEDSLSVGESIDIYGQKHPDRFEMKVHCIDKDGVNLYTYRYNNGRTSLARQRGGESCDDS